MTHDPVATLTDRRSTPPQQKPSLASCFWCDQPHPAAHPLSVCPVCTASFSTMRSLEMVGSFPLTDEAIDGLRMRRSAGNYALGYMDGASFVVFYVGRADHDVRTSLHRWVGNPSRYERYAPATKAAWGLRHNGPLPFGTPSSAPVECAETGYTHFAFSYADNADDAYEKEWRNYDAFGGGRGLDNDVEPASAVQ